MKNEFQLIYAFSLKPACVGQKCELLHYGDTWHINNIWQKLIQV